MTRICELTGKSVMSGHKVSHAVNRTKRKFLPNLQQVHLASDALGRSLSLRVSVAALRSVEHRGGIDAFLLKARPTTLSTKARYYRTQIVARQPEGEKRTPPTKRAPGPKATKARRQKSSAAETIAKEAASPKK